MKVLAAACCDRPSIVSANRASARCRNCGMRRGVPERPDLSALKPNLPPKALRAVEALALLGGKAGVAHVAMRANMTTREAGHLLGIAGCHQVTTRLKNYGGREVVQWQLPRPPAVTV